MKIDEFVNTHFPSNSKVCKVSDEMAMKIN